MKLGNQRHVKLLLHGESSIIETIQAGFAVFREPFSSTTARSQKNQILFKIGSTQPRPPDVSKTFHTDFLPKPCHGMEQRQGTIFLSKGPNRHCASPIK